MSNPNPNTFRYKPASFLKSAVDAERMSVDSVLTYPMPDLEGDFVEPAAGNFAEHAADPWVDLEHNQMAVGWGRESLYEQGAPYAVMLKSLTIDGKQHTLPVGTTFFDPHDRISTQVFALIERDYLPGVSLEFRATPGTEPRIRLKKSLINPNRPAFHFANWQCVRWTHCVQPVNPGALTVKKSVDPTLDPLVVALQSKKIGAEAMHPVILKSLSKYLPDKNRSQVHLEKAMPGAAPTDTPDTAYDTEGGEVDGEGGEKATPTAQSAYDAAQMLKDMCDHIKESLKDGEHVKGKKKLMKLCDAIDSLATKAAAVGDEVAKDVSGDEEMGDDEEPEGGMEGEEEGEGPDTEGDEEDEGVMKCFRHPKRKVYRKSVKRFTQREIRKAQTVTNTEATPEQVANLTKVVARLHKKIRNL